MFSKPLNRLYSFARSARFIYAAILSFIVLVVAFGVVQASGPTKLPKPHAGMGIWGQMCSIWCPIYALEPVPTIKILAVVKDSSVTIETSDFPPNEDFTVTMGRMYTRGINGFKVEEFNSGDGGSLQKTFDIPKELHGLYKISIRAQTGDRFPDYAYNWFYNNTTNGKQPLHVVLPQDDYDPNEVRAEITSLAESLGIDVEVEFTEPGAAFLGPLETSVNEGESSDLIGLDSEQGRDWASNGSLVPLDDYLDPSTFPFSIMGNQVDGDYYTMRWWPDSCYPYLGVQPSGNEEIAITLLEALAQRVDDDNKCEVENPDAEDWIPYQEPPSKDVLGIAELLPGDPVIVYDAIPQLEVILIEGEVKINSARAVVSREPVPQAQLLSSASSSVAESIHLAPIGENFDLDDGQIMSVTVFEAGYEEIDSGSYAVRMNLAGSYPEDSSLSAEYIAPDGSVVLMVELIAEPAATGSVAAGPAADEVSEAPTAGIFPGSRWCRVCSRWGCFSYPCGW